MKRIVEGRVFECGLIDDGTLDTVVSVNGHRIRYDSEFVARRPDGVIPANELDRLFVDAIDLVWDR